MATQQQLESALVNAHKAGDVAAATALANEIKGRQNMAAQINGMTHQQMADAYHLASTPAPMAEMLKERLSQPLQGESQDQTNTRLYGDGSNAAATAPKWMSAAGGVSDALTLGFGDEIDSGLISAATGKPYDETLTDFRHMQQGLHDANPWTYFTGQAAGSVAPALATGGGSMGSSLGSKILTGAATGAAQGGVYGFGSGEGGFRNRAISAGENAAAGGVLGGIAPVVARTIGGAWNAAAKGWQGLGEWLAGSGMDTKAANTIVEQLQQAGHTPESAAKFMDKLGPEGMLADAAPVFTAQTARATNEAGGAIGDALAQRRTAAPVRLGSDLDSVFGAAQDPYAVAQGIRAGKAAINPEYTQALAGNITLMPHSLNELSPELSKMASNMSLGNRQAMASHIAAIDDALSSSTPQEQAARLLDLRKNLDAQIVYDPRQAAMLSPADRAAQGVTKDARSIVDDILKNNVPGIAEADAAHAPLSRQQSAFDFGRKQLLAGGQNAVSPAEAASRMSTMSHAERQMATQGVRSEVARTMGNASANPTNAADRILGRDWNQQKVASLVGDSNAKRLADALDREATFNETSKLAEPGLGSRTSVTANNPWNPSEKPDNLLRDMAVGGFYGKEAGPVGAGVGAATPVVKRLAKAIMGNGKPDPALVKDVADKLVLTGDARQRLMALVAETADKSVSRVAKSAAVERIANLLAAPIARISARHASGVADSFLPRTGLLPQQQ